VDNIGIVTYPFISGLYYLADSFKKIEEDKGNNVFLFPKKSFINKDGKWISKIKYELDNFIHINENILYNIQLLTLVKKKNIKRIFSFETFMRDCSWVKTLRSNGVEVIDIPMPEWTNKIDIYTGKYNIFSSVYCLTEQSYDVFRSYANAKKITWDFCNQQPLVKTKNNILTLYHPGSNSLNNQKNTESVIDAFSSIENNDISLIISGVHNRKITDKRIIHIGSNLSRQKIYDAYSISDCIVSPSSREGLGMCFYEAKKFGCDIITTDYDPMRQHSRYLCKVSGYEENDSPIPFAIVSPSAIADQINKYYEDFYATK